MKALKVLVAMVCYGFAVNFLSSLPIGIVGPLLSATALPFLASALTRSFLGFSRAANLAMLAPALALMVYLVSLGFDPVRAVLAAACMCIFSAFGSFVGGNVEG